MVDISNLTKESVSLVEEKVPGGRVIAAIALTILALAVIVWGAKYIFVELLTPVASALPGRWGPAGWRRLRVQ